MAASLRYMGSKRSLAPRIADLITRRHPEATVVDAFAGTCAIGSALAARHRIIANDAHAFAEAVGRALLVTPGAAPRDAVAVRELRPHFDTNWAGLSKAIRTRLAGERSALTVLRKQSGWRELQTLTLAETRNASPRRCPGIATVRTYRSAPQRFPYALFTLCYASTYVGIEQAAEIDSLRYAITKADPARQDYYLLALLQAVSHAAATPGHFAQFLSPRNRKNTLYIGRMRARSIWTLFLKELRELSIPTCLDRKANAVSCQDATAFLRELPSMLRGRTAVIYADPPYSRAQYSRYYHVLETLVLYDYPDVTGKGRYRTARFTTDFSRRSKVVDAMKAFIGVAAKTRSPLYLSYPRNGLLHAAGGDLVELLRAEYPRVSIAETAEIAHSTLGAAPGTAAVKVQEDVYYARW